MREVMKGAPSDIGWDRWKTLTRVRVGPNVRVVVQIVEARDNYEYEPEEIYAVAQALEWAAGFLVQQRRRRWQWEDQAVAAVERGESVETAAEPVRPARRGRRRATP